MRHATKRKNPEQRLRHGFKPADHRGREGRGQGSTQEEGVVEQHAHGDRQEEGQVEPGVVQLGIPAHMAQFSVDERRRRQQGESVVRVELGRERMEEL